MHTRPTIGIFTGPEGHLSISEAIAHTLEKEFSVPVFFERDSSFSVYTPIYQYLPAAHKIPFELTKSDRVRKGISEFFKIKYQKKMEGFLSKHKPDLTISTYFMFNPNLVRYQQLTGKPFINVIPDPVSLHPMMVSSDAYQNLTFDQIETDACKKIFPEAKAQPVGWFVRPDFKPVKSSATVRQKLKLHPDYFTLLITAGSEGTTMIAKIVPLLFNVSQPIQVIVACGNNQALLRATKMLQEVVKNNTNSTLIPLKFVTNMHEYMQAADLVVGKAGPNTIFESTATHTPFFAVTHIAGQEDGNLDLIRNLNIGFVEENPIKAMNKLKKIIEHPESLHTLTDDIKKAAEHNRLAREKLIRIVKQALIN